MKSIVVYFSKAGEQYGVGTITKGNTALVAEIISEITQAPLFELKLKHDAYPETYKALTDAALKEKKENARPDLAGDVSDFDSYDTVFIGSPNWWGDLPMFFYSFFEKHDFSKKTVIPFITHEGSGLAGIDRKIKKAVQPKNMAEGLAIFGSMAQNNREETKKTVESWLKKIGF